MLFKKKEPKEVNKEIIEKNYDVILIFIGFSIVLLGVLHNFKKVPEEFLLGATLSGLFFAYSDFNLLKEKFYQKDVLYTLFFLFLGVFSFFLLPVILLVFPGSYKVVAPYGELATFLALGFIVVGIGFKSMDSKRKHLDKLTLELNKLKSTITEVNGKLEKTEKDVSELKLTEDSKLNM
ncbi:hypothetical protein V7114_18375 [Neobacillus niacini]|uniref:hypothetical protein n=1 Tax=Neobacillus niacini TaxID=86668 RepID=UPI002FFFA582